MSDPVTPNMSLIQPVTGVTTGSTANDEFNANWTTLDQHDHSPGKGAPLTPSGFTINTDLTFNGYNATALKSARFTAQSSTLVGASDLACLYFSGVDLYANDASGNAIRITSGGAVNATSSGISSGTATASFVASVLVVNADSNKPANVQCGSVLIGNNVTSSKYLTLAPPNSMAADYGLVLPAIPGSTSILAIDTSGNITGAYTVDNSTIDINGSSQIEVKDGGITPVKLAALGQQTSSSCGAFLTSSSSFVTVTNLSVSITTTGRPVFIGLMNDGSASGSGIGLIASNRGLVYQFRRGGTSLGAGSVVGGTGTMPVSSLWQIDAPAAGTYTYDFQVKAAFTTADIEYAKLIVYEL